MPNTTPRIDNQETVKFVQDRAKNASARVYVVGAITKNIDGKELSEIGDLVKMGCVAITDDGHYVQNPDIMRRALEYSKMFNLGLMQHAEDQYLVGSGVMNESFESTRLGLSGSPGGRRRDRGASRYRPLPPHRRAPAYPAYLDPSRDRCDPSGQDAKGSMSPPRPARIISC